MKKLQGILAIVVSAIILTSIAVTGAYAKTRAGEAIIMSEAEEYSCGNVNNDKDINMEDVVAVQKHIAKLTILKDAALKAADVTADEEVNMVDVTTLQKYIAKLIAELPYGEASSDEETDTDTSSNTETETESEVESDTDSSSDTETESDTSTDANSDTETESDTTTDTNSDTETESDTTTDTSTESDTESDTEEKTYLITLDIERFDWEHVYAYIWEETVPKEGESSQFVSAPAQWPGIEMTRDSATGYYILDISEFTNCNKIIFTNNKGQQTENLNLSFVSNGSAHYVLLGYIKY